MWLSTEFKPTELKCSVVRQRYWHPKMFNQTVVMKQLLAFILLLSVGQCFTPASLMFDHTFIN